MPEPLPLFIARDHPALEGHFPGQPVVPGVVLLEAVHAALCEVVPGLRLAGVPQVKFLQPVLPGMALQLEWHWQGATNDRIAFSCLHGEQVMASGQLQLHTDPP